MWVIITLFQVRPIWSLAKPPFQLQTSSLIIYKSQLSSTLKQHSVLSIFIHWPWSIPGAENSGEPRPGRGVGVGVEVVDAIGVPEPAKPREGSCIFRDVLHDPLMALREVDSSARMGHPSGWVVGQWLCFCLIFLIMWGFFGCGLHCKAAQLAPQLLHFPATKQLIFKPSTSMCKWISFRFKYILVW